MKLVYRRMLVKTPILLIWIPQIKVLFDLIFKKRGVLVSQVEKRKPIKTTLLIFPSLFPLASQEKQKN